MNHTKRVRPLRHRESREPGPAPERRDRGSASTLGRDAVLLVGALGVLLAFAGSAAAGTLISGKKIKDDTIRSVDLRDGRVRGVDVRDGSLTLTDFAPLPAGDQGPQGTPGLRGPDGVQVVSRPQQTRTLLLGERVDFSVACPAGSRVVGGGPSNDLPEDLRIEASYPTGGGWGVTVLNIGVRTSTVTATAVCVQ
jgi:hypothetical protein